jgi:hypothetical protein
MARCSGFQMGHRENKKASHVLNSTGLASLVDQKKDAYL